MPTLSASFLTLLAACGGAPAITHPVPAAGPVRVSGQGVVIAPSSSESSVLATAAIPPDEVTRALLSALRAHHAEDLPDAADLRARAGAEDALGWILAHELHVGTQARAARALGAFPTDTARARLLAVWRDPARHAEVRAAAMRALADHPVSARQPLEAEIAAGLEARDARLVIAAIRAADGLAGLSDKVTALGRAHPSPLVREAVAARP